MKYSRDNDNLISYKLSLGYLIDYLSNIYFFDLFIKASFFVIYYYDIVEDFELRISVRKKYDLIFWLRSIINRGKINKHNYKNFS